MSEKNENPIEQQSATEPTVASDEQAAHTQEESKKNKDKKQKKDSNSEKLMELGNKLNEISDKHLRLQAEFDNFRKRTLKEKADLIKSGGETVLARLLPVIDDFDRALGTLKGVDDNDPSKMGFILIFNKFQEFLKQSQVMEIEATGLDFDVELHEAITKIPAPAEELKGKVVDVVEKGYLLNGKVIRYAKVIIGE